MAKRIVKYPIDFAPGVVQYIPGEQFLATGRGSIGNPAIWTITDTSAPTPNPPTRNDLANYLRAVVLTTDDDMATLPDEDFVGHLGTFTDPSGVVWHVFALPSENYVAEARKAREEMAAQLAAMGGRLEPVDAADTNEA